MNSEEYTTGKCVVCGKDSPLKYGKCPDCQDSTDLPKAFKEIFGMNDRGEKK